MMLQDVTQDIVIKTLKVWCASVSGLVFARARARVCVCVCVCVTVCAVYLCS